MLRSARRAVSAAVALLLLQAPLGTAAAAPAHQPDTGQREGRTAVTVSPDVYADLVAAGVEITAVGRARVRPVDDTVKVRLPVTARSSTAVEHAGGIRFGSGDSWLVLRRLTIPSAGFVTGDIRGSDVASTDASALFLQSDSSSPLGDTALKFTWTLASKLNHSFDTTFRELGTFGYATVPQ